jgi:hypothetical protein
MVVVLDHYKVVVCVRLLYRCVGILSAAMAVLMVWEIAYEVRTGSALQIMRKRARLFPGLFQYFKNKIFEIYPLLLFSTKQHRRGYENPLRTGQSSSCQRQRALFSQPQLL